VDGSPHASTDSRDRRDTQVVALGSIACGILAPLVLWQSGVVIPMIIGAVGLVLAVLAWRRHARVAAVVGGLLNAGVLIFAVYLIVAFVSIGEVTL
jgi:uncharacterized membrane protein